jgi:hypothetical protein
MSAPVRVHEARCLDSLQRQWFFKDDFIGDQIQDIWAVSGSAGGSAVVVDGETGGIVRITTHTDDTDSYLLDWNDYRILLVTKRVSMEWKLKASDNDSDIEIRMGMDFDANNRIGFISNADANWRIRSMDGGGSTLEDSGIAETTSYMIFRIESHTHGGNHVHYFIDNVECANSPLSTNIPDDAADVLQPYIEVRTLEAGVAKSVDMDYISIRQDR